MSVAPRCCCICLRSEMGTLVHKSVKNGQKNKHQREKMPKISAMIVELCLSNGPTSNICNVSVSWGHPVSIFQLHTTVSVGICIWGHPVSVIICICEYLWAKVSGLSVPPKMYLLCALGGRLVAVWGHAHSMSGPGLGLVWGRPCHVWSGPVCLGLESHV